MCDWVGKIVLITGASAGIGRATAIHFSKLQVGGLALVARNEEKLKEVAEECRAGGVSDVLIIPKDLTREAACEEVIKRTTYHFKGTIFNLQCLNWNTLHTYIQLCDKKHL